MFPTFFCLLQLPVHIKLTSFQAKDNKLSHHHNKPSSVIKAVENWRSYGERILVGWKRGRFLATLMSGNLGENNFWWLPHFIRFDGGWQVHSWIYMTQLPCPITSEHCVQSILEFIFLKVWGWVWKRERKKEGYQDWWQDKNETLIYSNIACHQLLVFNFLILFWIQWQKYRSLLSLWTFYSWMNFYFPPFRRQRERERESYTEAQTQSTRMVVVMLLPL